MREWLHFEILDSCFRRNDGMDSGNDGRKVGMMRWTAGMAI